jgi:hypothetical protein
LRPLPCKIFILDRFVTKVPKLDTPEGRPTKHSLEENTWKKSVEKKLLYCNRLCLLYNCYFFLSVIRLEESRAQPSFLQHCPPQYEEWSPGRRAGKVRNKDEKKSCGDADPDPDLNLILMRIRILTSI